MNSENAIGKSPVVALFVVCTAVGSAVFGVTRYFHQQEISKIEQEYETRIGQTESQLARMQVGIGEAPDFDVQQVVCSFSETVSLPESSNWFAEDSFYAVQSDESWSYSQTTEGELFRMISGQSLEETELAGVADLVPLHLWTGPERLAVSHEGEQLQMMPMILLQRIPLEKLRQLTGMANVEPQSVVRQASFESTVDEQGNPELYHAILDDMTGKFFQFQMWLELGQSLNSPRTSHSLKRVQKLSNTLYSQSTTVMKQAEVNGRDIPALYVHNQMILISNRDGLYFVKIVLPTTEPALRNSTMAAVNGWLANLRIIVD